MYCIVFLLYGYMVYNAVGLANPIYFVIVDNTRGETTALPNGWAAQFATVVNTGDKQI